MDFIKVLFSGSKGNSTIFALGNTKIIIDAGVSRKRLIHALEEQNLTIDDSHILVTHHHSDHIKGLKQIVRKDSINLYGTTEIRERFYDTNVISNDFTIDDITVEILKVSHDAKDTLGYIVNYNNYKIVLISDTGYLSEKNLEKIANPDVLLLESNHDVDLLMNGSYSWPLKNRVLSDYGHLSNFQFKTYVNRVIGSNTKYLVALHLSEENNCHKIVSEMLDEIAVNNCMIAKQDCGCDLIKLDWK